jgi:hypothetical protein
MIKKILFVASIFVAGLVSAQSLQLLDHNDVDISGGTHLEMGTAADLSVTKFHLKNLTSNPVDFAVKVELVYNDSQNPCSDLQVCFGSACYLADESISGTQVIMSSGAPVAVNILGSAIYTDLKIGPFTSCWADCATDSSVWRVTAYVPSDPSDSTSAIITWKCDVLASVDDDVVVSAFNVYPNPATDNLTINYTVDGSVNNARMDVYDVLGQQVASHALNSNKGQINLSVDNLNAGVYFYSIKVDEKAIRTERVIIK